jgi:hypothetical protein
MLILCFHIAIPARPARGGDSRRGETVIPAPKSRRGAGLARAIPPIVYHPASVFVKAFCNYFNLIYFQNVARATYF